MSAAKKQSTSFGAFVAGMGSILCIYPTATQPPKTSDAQALRNDWRAIGSDYRKAILSVKHDSKTTRSKG